MADDAPMVDVERLVDDLRGRVRRLRREGAYGESVGSGALRMPAPEARVRFRPELGYSSKPVVGRPLTAFKRLILRLLFHVFDDLARQTDAAVRQVESQSSSAAEAAASSRRWAEAAIAAEVDGREQIARDVRELSGRIDALAESAERLQASPRLARLERASRSMPAPAPLARRADPRDADAPVTAALDYQTFEARFRGPEETVRDRQTVYLEHLRGRARVADLGCGRGELLALLREEGISAYGVDTEPEFVELVRERELDVVQEDLIAHLAGLEAGLVDALVVSHVVEHLPPERLIALVGLAAERLPEGGLLVMETPNPESLLAGSINFHRDPTHLRPVHPDTLGFLCESAGFRAVEVLRLAPVPDDSRLPVGAPGAEELARHLDRVVEQLNGIIYGWQDYAILATR